MIYSQQKKILTQNSVDFDDLSTFVVIFVLPLCKCVETEKYALQTFWPLGCMQVIRNRVTQKTV